MRAVTREQARDVNTTHLPQRKWLDSESDLGVSRESRRHQCRSDRPATSGRKLEKKINGSGLLQF